MDYRRLGDSSLQVSPLCLGTMMFGGRSSPATAKRIIARARDAGVNFIDTADAYVGGRSEEIVGSAIKAERDHWVLATKFGNRIGDRPNDGGLGRHWMHRAIEASLRRLRTEVIDVYYLHLEDHDTPLEETVSAMGDLIAAGKVRYFGVSNFRSWRIAEVVWLCGELGVDPPIVCQPYYNAVNRQPEVEVLPACDHYGLGVVPYSPLARGVLTGKYQPGRKPPPTSRAGIRDPRMLNSEWRPESLEIAQRIKAHAEARGSTATSFAVNWLLNNQIVTSVLSGPRTVQQWNDYVRALDDDFTSEDEDLLNSLVATGHPSTPGYNDPNYPIEGRPTWTE